MPMPIPPLALVLDLDGTLVDSLPDIQRSLSLALAQVGLRGLSRAETRAMLGDGAERLVARALKLTGGPDSAKARQGLLERFLAHYEHHSTETSRCFAGVEATLEVLARQGHRLGVCTNKPHRATLRMLQTLGLEERFHAVLGGDLLPIRKPDPEHLWATVRAMGGQGRPVVMVGDCAPDAQVAQRAGVPFVLAAYGYARVPLEQLQADAVFQRFDQLPRVLERLGLGST